MFCARSSTGDAKHASSFGFDVMISQTSARDWVQRLKDSERHYISSSERHLIPPCALTSARVNVAEMKDGVLLGELISDLIVLVRQLFTDLGVLIRQDIHHFVMLSFKGRPNRGVLCVQVGVDNVEVAIESRV